MDLGNFSVSLSVRDIEASRVFYEKLGFAPTMGDASQGWLILKNGDTVIGLFQGMFEKNTLTFNPGWDRNATALGSFIDVRELQRQLKAQGVEFVSEVDESGSGPGSFVVADPDGNPILFDQHVYGVGPVVVAVDPGIEYLLRSTEPLIQYRALVDLAGANDDDPRVIEARRAIPGGSIVRTLIEDRPSKHPYSKWTGLHWRLVSLMDLGAPADLPGLRDAVDGELRWLTGPGPNPRARKVQVINGLTRWCASIEGNGLSVASQFGLADDRRAHAIAESLLDWQWPDGGWNCDRHEVAHHSSVNESFEVLRGLTRFAAATEDRRAATAAARGADRAAEFFLRHRVAYSERSGAPMHRVVVRLHYPPYWHYDFLAGLRALSDAGRIADPRTADALDLLEEKRLPDGTWAPDEKHYRRPGTASSLVEVVDWANADRTSEALTLSALSVLKAAGRV